MVLVEERNAQGFRQGDWGLQQRLSDDFGIISFLLAMELELGSSVTKLV